MIHIANERQEFLSTDFNSAPLMITMGAILVIMIGGGYLLSKVSQARNWKIDVASHFVGVCMLTLIMSMTILGLVSSTQQIDNLAANILTAYDLDEVYDLSNNMSEPTDIIVVKDGVPHEVLLMQDSETYEPTLTSPSTDFDVKELRK